MKAIIYGPSSTLQLAEIDRPVPREGEVLIRVMAASVNPVDGHLLKASPLIRTIMYRMIGARAARPGADIAGIVEAVGTNVTDFAPGDEVFGASGGGGFSEFACPPENKIVKKPGSVSFDAAATANVAGLTAYQGLRGVKNGERVLIIGASGGVGTFAVQIAKWMGADVTAVCSTRNVEMVRSLGSDRVIDYTSENFTKGGIQYDVIYDLVGDKSFSEYSGVLKPSGRYIGAGILSSEGSMLKVIPGMIYTALRAAFSKKKFTSFMAKINKDDLADLADLMESGKLTPVIDRTYPLEETAAAVRYVAAKHARGKVVISVDRINNIPPPAKFDQAVAKSG